MYFWYSLNDSKGFARPIKTQAKSFRKFDIVINCFFGNMADWLIQISSETSFF